MYNTNDIIFFLDNHYKTKNKPIEDVLMGLLLYYLYDQYSTSLFNEADEIAFHSKDYPARFGCSFKHKRSNQPISIKDQKRILAITNPIVKLYYSRPKFLYYKNPFTSSSKSKINVRDYSELFSKKQKFQIACDKVLDVCFSALIGLTLIVLFGIITIGFSDAFLTDSVYKTTKTKVIYQNTENASITIKDERGQEIKTGNTLKRTQLEALNPGCNPKQMTVEAKNKNDEVATRDLDILSEDFVVPESTTDSYQIERIEIVQKKQTLTNKIFKSLTKTYDRGSFLRIIFKDTTKKSKSLEKLLAD